MVAAQLHQQQHQTTKEEESLFQTNAQLGDLLRGVLQDKGSLLNKLVQDEGGHHHLETHHKLYGDHLKHEEGLPILKEEIFLPHLHMPKEDIKLPKVDMKLPKVDMKLPKARTYCHRHRPPRSRPTSPPVMIYHRLYQQKDALLCEGRLGPPTQ